MYVIFNEEEIKRINISNCILTSIAILISILHTACYAVIAQRQRIVCYSNVVERDIAITKHILYCFWHSTPLI